MMMKSTKAAIAILLLLCLLVLNGVAVLTPANATDASFSAGNKLVKDGQVIGCSCPVQRGACVCEYKPN